LIGGFAKRCSDRSLILKRFIEQTGGEYAKTLHNLFGMSATQASLYKYLSKLDEFVEFCITNNLSTNRWGGGIGLLRVMDCMDNLD